MNKKTLALTPEQYYDIILTMRQGFLGHRPNNQAATALVLEANLGIRISDVLALTPDSFVRDGFRWRLDIVEKKTGKTRNFTVINEIYKYVMDYCCENQIVCGRIFSISPRAVQRALEHVCDYKGYTGISTHSFRKFFATSIYVNNDYDILMVQELLQHASPAVTQRYIGMGTKRIEAALHAHLCLC